MLKAYPMPGGVVARVEISRLDAVISIRFKDALREIVSCHGARLILDLGNVEFMDSSGLGAILAVRRSLADPRRMELACLTPNVDRVMRLTRMDTIFTIHNELPPEAVAAVAEAGGQEGGIDDAGAALADTAVVAAEDSLPPAPTASPRQAAPGGWVRHG